MLLLSKTAWQRTASVWDAVPQLAFVSALESHAAGITSIKFHPHSKQSFLDWGGYGLEVVFSQDGTFSTGLLTIADIGKMLSAAFFFPLSWSPPVSRLGGNLQKDPLLYFSCSVRTAVDVRHLFRGGLFAGQKGDSSAAQPSFGSLSKFTKYLSSCESREVNFSLWTLVFLAILWKHFSLEIQLLWKVSQDL